MEYNKKKSEIKQKNRKKAVIAIAGSFRLYQAIYMTYFFDEYDWDVVIMAYGKEKDINQHLYNICERSGCFNNIYYAQTPTQYSGSVHLLIECIKMFISYITGGRKKYAKKLISKTLKHIDYDMICIACSYSLMEGAFLCLSDEKKVIVMEEGLDDYVGQKLEYSLVKNIGAYLLYKMQYVNLLGTNNYKPLKYCEKYVRYPELIRDNIYLKVNKMFDFSKIDVEGFRKTITKAFNIGNEEYDVVIYTDPLYHYGIEEELEAFVSYISDKYKNSRILLKRHPQDLYNYNFSNVEVSERYLEVPGEMVLKQWNKAVHIFTYPSTILLGSSLENYNYELINFSKAKSKTYIKIIEELIEFLKIDREKVVNL